MYVLVIRHLLHQNLIGACQLARDQLAKPRMQIQLGSRHIFTISFCGRHYRLGKHTQLTSKHGENVLKTKMGISIFIAQKMRISIKQFFCKCDQIRSFLRIWSQLLKKSLIENFIFCAANILDLSNKEESFLLK